MKSSDSRFDRSVGDVGNIVEFGHVNLRVPDQDMALAFHVDALGLTRDPEHRTGLDNAWINVGDAQFHLPVGAPQVLRGTIHLVMPDLDALRRRLAANARRFDGTAFGAIERGGAVEVTCPWGNRIDLHAPDAARYGRMRLGMPCIAYDVAPGTATRIARFYREMLHGNAHCDERAGVVLATVAMGPGSWLMFREVAYPLPAYDGHHIQVSVADFSGAHRRLQQHGLITEESDPHQYRFTRIIDVDDGEVLVDLEHEVRSMRHPLYGRTLANDGPAGSSVPAHQGSIDEPRTAGAPA